jgi:hypothetical protein
MSWEMARRGQAEVPKRFLRPNTVGVWLLAQRDSEKVGSDLSYNLETGRNNRNGDSPGSERRSDQIFAEPGREIAARSTKRGEWHVQESLVKPMGRWGFTGLLRGDMIAERIRKYMHQVTNKLQKLMCDLITTFINEADESKIRIRINPRTWIQHGKWESYFVILKFWSKEYLLPGHWELMGHGFLPVD